MRPHHDFELILEYKQPIAAIYPQRLAAEQLVAIYAILPESSILQTGLAQRWNAAMVLAPTDWAVEQFHRVPMVPPRGVSIKLAFVS